MNPFSWIIQTLYSKGDPLAVSIAGFLVVSMTIGATYLGLQKAGLVGTGKSEKKINELNAKIDLLNTKLSESQVAAARAEERSRYLEDQLSTERKSYEKDMADETARTDVFIDRIKKIAELEQTLGGGRSEQH